MRKVLVTTLIFLNILALVVLFTFVGYINMKVNVIDECQNKIIKSLNAVIENGTESSFSPNPNGKTTVWGEAANITGMGIGAH